jgi:16S rRNA processing protein RimM
MATQDLIAMEFQGQEVLIPVNDAMIQGVNRPEKTLNVTLPEGLVEVYTEGTNAVADDEDSELEDQ